MLFINPLLRISGADLRPGDVLWRKGNEFNIAGHWGLYVGNDHVIHNMDSRGVVIDTIDVFAEGKNLYLKMSAPEGLQQQIVDRAKAMMGKPFDWVLFNCHDLVRKAYGSPMMIDVIGSATGPFGKPHPILRS